MTSSARRWLYRFLIAIFGLVVLLLLGAVAAYMLEGHRTAQFDRTYERPLVNDPRDPVLVPAHEILAHLDTVNRENSLQFAAMPSFGDQWFGVSLSELDNNAIGQVIVISRTDGNADVRNFALPLDKLLAFFAEWDTRTKGYSGDSAFFTDGTPIAFERWRGQQVWSGVGNSPCHYAVLGDISAQYLVPYVPELHDLRSPGIDKLLESNVC